MAPAKELLKELLQIGIYGVSSAMNLDQEPKDYGPLRVMEMTERILACCANLDDDTSLKKLVEEINEKKILVLNNKEEFNRLCENVLSALIEKIKLMKSDKE